MLRLNVGFLLKEGIGYSREFSFDEPEVTFPDDFTVQDLHGSVTLTRTPQGLYSKGQLEASLDHECSRCLTDFDLTVTSNLGDLYHYPPESAPPESLTVADDVHLDLTPVVREDFLLSIPLKALCRPDCMGLCPQCGANWNEGPCDCNNEVEIDPRLAGLASLLGGPQGPEQEPPAN